MSTIHRGDVLRARKSLTSAMLELEVAEVKASHAVELGELPADVFHNMYRARAAAVEAERLLRRFADVDLSGSWRHYAAATDPGRDRLSGVA